MTIQKGKNPQTDIAENNAFFPSEYSLDLYTNPISDLDGVDYPEPYSGTKRIRFSLSGRGRGSQVESVKTLTSCTTIFQHCCHSLRMRFSRYVLVLSME